MYASDWARFLSPDPAGLRAARLNSPKSLNRYAYTEGNPINYRDPSGLGIFGWLSSFWGWLRNQDSTPPRNLYDELPHLHDRPTVDPEMPGELPPDPGGPVDAITPEQVGSLAKDWLTNNPECAAALKVLGFTIEDVEKQVMGLKITDMNIGTIFNRTPYYRDLTLGTLGLVANNTDPSYGVTLADYMIQLGNIAVATPKGTLLGPGIIFGPTFHGFDTVKQGIFIVHELMHLFTVGYNHDAILKKFDLLYIGEDKDEGAKNEAINQWLQNKCRSLNTNKRGDVKR